MDDRTQKPSQDAGIELLHRNGLRLLELVNTLLDFSRIEAAYEPADLGQLTSDLASVFRSAMERAGLHLLIDCPPLPEPVYADREMWEKIVLNLLSNALKFTFVGEVEVSLRWIGAGAELRVRDTGIGIPESELPHCFERFFRVRGSHGRTQEGSGIGLGLAIVRHIVELHGGSVAVANATDRSGAIFTVVLPLQAESHPGESAIPADAAPSAAEGPAPAGRLEGLQVLVVEYDTDTRRLFADVLRKEGAAVQTVAGIAEALTVYDAGPLDMLVSDLGLPGEDGYSLIRRVRRREARRGGQMPAIALTAYVAAANQQKAFAAGYQEHLAKPLDPATLVDVVAHLAGHK